MPLNRRPDTEELEDHAFGSGAFQYGWFYPIGDKFPFILVEVEPDTQEEIQRRIVTEDDFIEGIKKYAEHHPTNYFDNLIDDMDAPDVDNVFQFVMFGEIRYS